MNSLLQKQKIKPVTQKFQRKPKFRNQNEESDQNLNVSLKLVNKTQIVRSTREFDKKRDTSQSPIPQNQILNQTKIINSQRQIDSQFIIKSNQNINPQSKSLSPRKQRAIFSEFVNPQNSDQIKKYEFKGVQITSQFKNKGQVSQIKSGGNSPDSKQLYQKKKLTIFPSINQNQKQTSNNNTMNNSLQNQRNSQQFSSQNNLDYQENSPLLKSKFKTITQVQEKYKTTMNKNNISIGSPSPKKQNANSILINNQKLTLKNQNSMSSEESYNQKQYFFKNNAQQSNVMYKQLNQSVRHFKIQKKQLSPNSSKYLNKTTFIKKVPFQNQQPKQQIFSLKYLDSINDLDKNELKNVIQSMNTIDPKVNQAYQHRQGEVPRNVVIERKKKLFSSLNILDLLEQAEINMETVLLKDSKYNWLPLELFDSIEVWDDYSPNQWIQKAFDGDNEKIILAKALYYNIKTTKFEYQKVIIKGYDEKDKKFMAQWVEVENNQNIKLDRLYFCFDAEDPRKYVQRIKNAIEKRVYCDSLIRYNYIIDCMPLQDQQGLDRQQKLRIEENGKSLQNLKYKNCDVYLEQADIDYKRTMNKIYFDHYLKNESKETHHLYPSDLIFEPPTIFSKIPIINVINNPFHIVLNYDKRIENKDNNQKETIIGVQEEKTIHTLYQSFKFHSLFSKEETLKTLIIVKEECLKAEKLRFFDFKDQQYGMKLEEFCSIQESQLMSTLVYLKKNWVNNIVDGINQSFQNIGKGWFNIQENNRDSYEFGKFKKFLQLISLMMQDTLYIIVQESYQEIIQQLLPLIPARVDIQSISNVKNIPNVNQKQIAQPLFQIEVIYNQKTGERGEQQTEINYKESPQNFHYYLNNLIHKPLKEIMKIPEVSPYILEKFFAQEQGIKCLPAPVILLDDKNTKINRYSWLLEYIQILDKRVDESIQPIKYYILQHEKYRKIFQLNAVEIKNDMEKRDMEVEIVQKDIFRMAEREVEVGQEIPQIIQVGMFQVKQEYLKEGLENIYQDIQKELKNYIYQKTQQIQSQILIFVDNLKRNINFIPKSIEEVQQIFDFIEKIPKQLNSIQYEKVQYYKNDSILENLQYKHTRAELIKHWEVFSIDYDMKKNIQKIQEKLKLHTQNFKIQCEEDTEEFQNKIIQLQETINIYKTYDDISQHSHYSDIGNNINTRIQEFTSTALILKKRQKIFKMQEINFNDLGEMSENFKIYKDFWVSASQWIEHKSFLLNSQLKLLSAKDSKKLQENCLNSIREAKQYFKSILNQQMYRNSDELETDLLQFRQYQSILTAFKKDGLRDRHWEIIYEILGIKQFSPTQHKKNTFGYFIDIGVVNHSQTLIEISEKAFKEFSIEQSLEEMNQRWHEIQFNIQKHKNNTVIIIGYDDISDLMDEDLVKTQRLNYSVYKKPFEQQIVNWNRSLKLMIDIIEVWNKFQKKWLYLQPIFESPDISEQLPGETKKYGTIDSFWRHLMTTVKGNNNVQALCLQEGMIERLQDGLRSLEQIQNELYNYLEKKCEKFGRFYFLSNNDLISILSLQSEPWLIQPHLRKVFENIDQIQFDYYDRSIITHMKSQENEVVQFNEQIKTKGKMAEAWMQDIEKNMQITVKQTLLDCLKDGQICYFGEQEVFNKWIRENPGMHIITTAQIIHTNQIEEALYSKNPNKLLMSYKTKLQKLLEILVINIKNQQDQIIRTTINSLIVNIVNNLDIIEMFIIADYKVEAKSMDSSGDEQFSKSFNNSQNDMVIEDAQKQNDLNGNTLNPMTKTKMKQKKISDFQNNQFEWLLQLRYYVQDLDNIDNFSCTIKCIQSEQQYGCEYLGNTQRLVITPLTVKCCITLMQACKYNFGGLAAGPAGTGKTETVKDLSKSLAKQCVVFNCSDAMDYIMTAKFFKGLSTSGSWCCFDEFNRMQVEVLSVIAQQLMVLFKARASQEDSKINFEGSDIIVKNSFSIFVTMNPGYQGKVKLPDNLKALFRQCAMIVPDYLLITEIILYSYGFKHAKKLSQKIIFTIQLAQEQLSQQPHYDFSLRQVKAIISISEQYKLIMEDLQNMTEKQEIELVLKSLTLVLIPKLISQDETLFKNIIKDQFQDYQIFKRENEIELKDQIINTIKKLKLNPLEIFVQKIEQTASILQTMHGLMIIGETGTGKSTNIHVLQQTFEDYGIVINIHRINPKSMTIGQLFGQTLIEFKHGILSNVVKNCSLDSSNDQHWITMDGPIDTYWIENINSVLDETRKLCLSNSSILTFTQYMKMLFEIENLENSSPSIVSRCAMVYMPKDYSNVNILWESWCQQMNIAFRKLKIDKKYKDMMDYYLLPCLKFIKKKCVQVIPVDNSIMVESFLKVLKSLIKQFEYHNYEENSSQAPARNNKKNYNDDMQRTNESPKKLNLNEQVDKNQTISNFEDFHNQSSMSQVSAQQNLKLNLSLKNRNTQNGQNNNPFKKQDSIIEIVQNNIGKRKKDKISLGNEEEMLEDDVDIPVKAQENAKRLKIIMEPLFFSVLLWTLGSSIDTNSQFKFDVYLKELIKKDNSTSVDLPKNKTLFDYIYDIDEKRFIELESLIASKTYGKTEFGFCDMLVQTEDSILIQYQLNHVIDNLQPCLCIGSKTRGKTKTIQNLLDFQIDQSIFSYQMMYFTGETQTTYVRDFLFSKLEKRRKKVYGPNLGKKHVFFIDDLSCPKPTEFGSEPILELLREFIEQKGTYNIKDLDFINFEQVVVVGATKSQSQMSQRLVRQFVIFGNDKLQLQTKTSIFTKLLSIYLSDFTGQIKLSLQNIVESSIQIQEEFGKTFLPTPSKNFYSFTIKDIWRQFNIIQMTDKEEVHDLKVFLNLWYHENLRTYQDRLVQKSERRYVEQICLQHLENLCKQFSLKIEDVLCQKKDDENFGKNILWADFIQKQGYKKKYSMVSSMSDFIQKMENFQEKYNSDYTFAISGKKQLNLIMFKDACISITSISRNIKGSMSHCIVLGSGGKGRASLSRLSCFVANLKLYEAGINQNYNLKIWTEDLRRILMNCSIDKFKVGFIISCKKIIHDKMLDDLTQILFTGTLCNLFNEKDELEIQFGCQQECLKKGLQPTTDNLNAIYKNRIKQNLHVILAMSPTQSDFQKRVRYFPGIFGSCEIVYLNDWSNESLASVAQIQIEDDLTNLQMKKEQINSFVESAMQIHRYIEQVVEQMKTEQRKTVHVEPIQFLDSIVMFKHIFEKKNNNTSNQRERMTKGFTILKQGQQKVQEMEEELKVLKPQLENSCVQLEKLIEQIKQDQENSQKKMAQLKNEQQEAQEYEKQANILKEEVVDKLKESELQLQDTMQNISKLKKDHLTEIKSLVTPPQAVKVTIEGIVIFFEDKIEKKGGSLIIKENVVQENGRNTIKREENYFETAKRYLLNDPRDLLDSLINYNKQEMTQQQMDKLEKQVLCKKEFNIDAVKRTSYATKYLFDWIQGNIKYYKQLLKTLPIKEKLSNINIQLETNQNELKKLQQELMDIKKQLEILEQKKEETIQERQYLDDKIKSVILKHQRAKQLTSALNKEGIRWEEIVNSFHEQDKYILGNSFLVAFQIINFGPLDIKYSDLVFQYMLKVMKNHEILANEDGDIVQFLGSEQRIFELRNYGLAKDKNSTQNALILEEIKRWPLLIDPQGQAVQYLTNFGGEQSVQIINDTDTELMKNLELGLSLGKWIIIKTNSEEIDSSLNPILDKQVEQINEIKTIKIGEKSLQFNPEFRLFLCTNISNPTYAPEIFVKLSVLNFSVSSQALEEQMLALIVSIENPFLEKKKLELMQQAIEQKMQLLSIEDQILKTLSDTESSVMSILNDENLIAQLSNTKVVADQVQQVIIEGAKTAEEIDNNREDYRALAKVANLLYLSILDLSPINHMYRYSLEWFQAIFAKGLENLPSFKSFNDRIQKIKEIQMQQFFENVCMSLYEEHKILYSFFVTIREQRELKGFTDDEWNFLLQKVIVKQQNKNPQNQGEPQNQKVISRNQKQIQEINIDEVHISQQIYNNLQQLIKVEGYAQIETQSFNEYKTEFLQFFQSIEPYHSNQYFSKIKKQGFQKLLLIKVFRPDKLVDSIQMYIKQFLGESFIKLPSVDIDYLYQNSSHKTPFIFLLKDGQDPRENFLKYVDDKSMHKRSIIVSLGQGQGIKAEAQIRLAQKRGWWILLENCHLSKYWLPTLDLITHSFDSQLNQDYRLWLTTKPLKEFPLQVLQSGIKMSVQPPQGVRASLIQTYNDMTDNDLNDSSHPQIFAMLVFSLSFLHAIIQDRNKYGSIGWNVQYDFTIQDLIISKKQMRDILETIDEGQPLPFSIIQKLVGYIHYNGKITDQDDSSLLQQYINIYLTPEILQEGYQFSDINLYYQPEYGNHKSYMNYINQLPVITQPEAFGLHPNSDIRMGNERSEYILTALSLISPSQSALTQFSLQQQHRQSQQFEQSPVKQQQNMQSISSNTTEEATEFIIFYVQKNLPQVFDIEEIKSQFQIQYKDSMNTVLIQEVIRYNTLLKVINDSLSKLNLAIKGLDSMDDQLERLINNLLSQKVPELWNYYGFESTKSLTLWLKELDDRVIYFHNWINKGIPNVFWIGCFFRPSIFLIGIKMNFARQMNSELDLIKLDTIVMDKYKNYSQQSIEQVIKKPPEIGAYIFGVHLEAGQWNSIEHCLMDPAPLQMFSMLPPIHLKPVINFIPKVNSYKCPFYKTLTRFGNINSIGNSNNFVMYMYLNGTEKQNGRYWQLAGLAAFQSLNS